MWGESWAVIRACIHSTRLTPGGKLYHSISTSGRIPWNSSRMALPRGVSPSSPPPKPLSSMIRWIVFNTGALVTSMTRVTSFSIVCGVPSTMMVSLTTSLMILVTCFSTTFSTSTTLGWQAPSAAPAATVPNTRSRFRRVISSDMFSSPSTRMYHIVRDKSEGVNWSRAGDVGRWGNQPSPKGQVAVVCPTVLRSS